MVAVSLKKFFFKQKTAYEMQRSLVGSEMCIRDRLHILPPGFVKIRHFGFLAHPHRRSALLLSRKLLCAPVSPHPLPDVQQKAVAHKCPHCGIGTLCFLAWIPAGAVLNSLALVPVFVDSS